MRKVGIIGSGALAQAVAARLLEYGEFVLVWGPDEQGVAECVRAGAAPAMTPAEVASQSQLIIVTAADGPESERWLTGDHGVVQGMCDGHIVIDMTTVSPALAHKLARECEEAGARS